MGPIHHLKMFLLLKMVVFQPAILDFLEGISFIPKDFAWQLHGGCFSWWLVEIVFPLQSVASKFLQKEKAMKIWEDHCQV